jgi:hypothetical protein
VHEVGEELGLLLPGHARAPVLQGQQREQTGGAVVGMAVERVGQRHDGRPRFAHDLRELAPQVVAVVGDVRLQHQIVVRRIAGSGGARARRTAAPPVGLQQAVEPAVGEPEHGHAGMIGHQHA